MPVAWSLFTGTNEVMVTNDYNAPTAEYLAAQNGFNQVFVSTIRSSTGGRNAYRYLVVQGFNTNIAYTVTGFKTPKDPASNRLFLEIHFYDPYDFTINSSNTTATEWGNSAPSAKTAGWGNETYVDTILAQLKTSFGSKGLPVIMGEYGTILKTTSDNPQYRQYWTQYVTGDASKNGIIPQTPKPTGIATTTRAGNRTWARLEGGALTVDLAGGVAGTARLLDIEGRTVVSGLQIAPGRRDYPVGHLRPGNYFLQIRTPQGSQQMAIAGWN